jgi:hypothetical protein
MSVGTLRDLTIADPPMEQVIRELYDAASGRPALRVPDEIGAGP